MFSNQWGKLVEALLGNGTVAIFRQRGINVTRLFGNIKSTYHGGNMEIDALLVNGSEAVAVEIKTTARVETVNELLEDLREFKNYFPEYANRKIYGAIAALKFQENAERYAEGQGLFVIEPAGENLVRIQNGKSFVPKAF